MCINSSPEENPAKAQDSGALGRPPAPSCPGALGALWDRGCWESLAAPAGAPRAPQRGQPGPKGDTARDKQRERRQGKDKESTAARVGGGDGEQDAPPRTGEQALASEGKLSTQSCFLLQSSFKRSLAIRWLTTNVSGKGLRTLAKIRKQKVTDLFCTLDVSERAGSDLIHSDVSRKLVKHPWAQ